MAEPIYADLTFPDPPEGRPYVLLNMVTTIDGKIVTGDRDDDVFDLGSPTDHATMHVIEAAADGIIMGARTIRATPKMNLPDHLVRFAVTRTGDIPRDNGFVTDRTWLIGPEPGSTDLPVIPHKTWPETLATLRRDHGIRRLLCEGGSELNAQLFAAGLIDEIFWTIAPKVKLGAATPTMADGEPIPRAEIPRFRLVSCTPHGDEVFMRYRRLG
ncbi:MAG: RibD family protein [Fimbriimonadaceae bacterium]|nr:RibD family protein [Fimbriimonadaceae bacterium]